MNIEIKNCNNIDTANITIEEEKLNIKFAPNGTGKSTISNAINFALNGEDLSRLLPFKYRENNPGGIIPNVIGIEGLRSVLCFNEEYVNQFVFKQDEVLNNSFDIFIRTDEYKETEKQIDELVSEIKDFFTDNEELETLIATLKELGKAFKLTKTGIAKSSTGMKGLSNGNKIQHIPEGLEAYKPFIQSSNSVNWVDWQTKGNSFIDDNICCPFCTSDTGDKQELIERVSKEYDKNIIKNLVGIINVIERLGEYFSEDAKRKLAIITSSQDGLEKEHESFLVRVKKQIDNFVEKLEKLKSLSGFQFKEGENVAVKLSSLKLDLEFFEDLKSAKTEESIAPINNSINEIINKAGILQGKINIQRKEMRKIIHERQNDINNFLSYAGYNYKVEIAGEGDQAQLKLLHIDHTSHISGGNQHLSYGERNAFAIVLFMYECLSKKPDLIILDDPISSFDKNKKYAIMEMLFRRKKENCLKKKNVIMLTHDVEPIIDTVKSLSSIFCNLTTASFLKLYDGDITECDIRKDDIQTFAEICNSVIESSSDDIIKLIYMRRHYEIANNKGDAYQVLSNLFHLRETAIDNREEQTEGDSFPQMNNLKFQKGVELIQEKLPSFSYQNLLNRVKNLSALKLLYHSSSNGYEKLQIFRLMNFNVESSVIRKFINEAYHIENEFICQLAPNKFDTIPQYVINECDKIVMETELC